MQDTIEPIEPQQEVNPADYLFEPDGRLKQFLPLDAMDVSNGQMHFLVPPGIGDNAWILAKFLPLKDRITFWVNNDETKRSVPYFEMMGCRVKTCAVDIRRLYEYPGEFSEEKAAEGGFIGYVHANHHIESGKRIEDWHPFLPVVNPVDSVTGRWAGEDEDPIAVHMGSANYQEGNYPPRTWAKALRRIEETHNRPVLCVGAFWDAPFAKRVFDHYKPNLQPMIDCDLPDVLEAIRFCRGFIGVDSGMAILSKYMGVPTLQAYPEWLCTTKPSPRHPNGTHMPGSWEFDHHPKSAWTFVGDLLDEDAELYYEKWLGGL